MFRDVLNYLFKGAPDAGVQLEEDIKNSVAEVKLYVANTEETLKDLFLSAELAQNKEEITPRLKKVNHVKRIFLRVVPGRHGFDRLRKALKQVGISEKFNEHLDKAWTLEDAIMKWKLSLLQDVRIRITQKKAEDILDNKIDQELIDRFLPHSDNSNAESKEQIEVKYTQRKRRKLKKGSIGVFTSIKFNDMKRKGVCFRYQKNKCRKGNSCKFKHVRYC